VGNAAMGVVAAVAARFRMRHYIYTIKGMACR